VLRLLRPVARVHRPVTLDVEARTVGLLDYVPRVCGDGVLRQWQAILSRAVREADGEAQRAGVQGPLDAVNAELAERAALRARRAVELEGR
jgi:hypothetical protein